MLTQPCVITNYTDGPRDDYNAPTKVPSSKATTTFLQMLTEEEDTYLRDTGRVASRAYFRPDVAVSMESKVTIDGEDYDVVSPVVKIWNPRNREVHHIQVLVTKAV